MKIKPLLVCLILIGGFPFLTGCWDRIEIEERGAILGLAIDPVDGSKIANITGPYAKSDVAGYKLTAQIAIPGRIPLGASVSGGEKAENPLWIVTFTGKTIDDAMNNLQQEIASKVFLGHLRVIIVNQKLARSGGMHDIQDFFRRNAEIRRLAWLIISTGSAEQAMKAVPKLERVPTLYFVSTMDQAVKMGRLPNIFLGNFWSILSSRGRDPVLPLISVFGKDQIRVRGLAVFKGEKMVGSLAPLEVSTYLELANEKRAGYSIAVPLPGDPSHSVMAKGMTRTVKIRLRKDSGKVPSFDVYSRLEMNITEKTGVTRLDNQVIRQISAEEAKLLENSQEKMISKLKQMNTDILGFGEAVRGQYPDYWSQYGTREAWEKQFPDIPIRVHVNVDIRRTGMSSV